MAEDDLMNQEVLSYHLQRDDFELRVEFALSSKSSLGIFGPSGSGKTSLLRCMAGLEKSQSPLAFRSSMLFQEDVLFEHFNVKQNLDFARKQASATRERFPDVFSIIKSLDLQHLMYRRAWQLSGGEKKRVALAQRLMTQPECLLLDEPTLHLDSRSRKGILDFLLWLRDNCSLLLVLVSHDLQDISRLCDQILIMKGGKSVFYDEVSRALTSPSSPLLADSADYGVKPFVTIEAEVEAFDGQYGISELRTEKGTRLRILNKLSCGEKHWVRIDADQVSLMPVEAGDSSTTLAPSSILNRLPARVQSLLRISDNKILLLLDVSGDKMMSEISRLSWDLLNLKEGSQVLAQVKATSISRSRDVIAD